MDTKKTQRVLVPGDDLDHDAISSAIALGIELSKEKAKEIDGVVLFVPTKALIRNSSLETVIGENFAKPLYKGERIQLLPEVFLRAETIKTYKLKHQKNIVIAIYADAKMMDQLDGMANLHTIIAVPHLPNALDEWVKTWSPSILGSDNSSEEELIGDNVIESALTVLTNIINLSHTILNPRDKESVENTIRILRRNNHSENSSNIRAWAIKNDWHPKAAEELKNIWTKIFKLKNTPTIKDPEQAKKSYEYWVSKTK